VRKIGQIYGCLYFIAFMKHQPKNLVRFAHNWNVGILGFGQMEYWDNGKILLDSEVDKRVSFR
jgi:hypothetical protein